MRIAFYAPLKPPTHPVPSGDRRMARLLMMALRRAGHRVELASRLWSLDASGDSARQAAIEGRGRRTAARLARAYGARPRADRPAAWFTYHLHYKAPDWIGPLVADALSIPYVVAEASHAPKRAGGPWDAGHAAAAAAIRRAAAIFTLNPADAGCLAALLGGTERLIPISPFLDAAAFKAAARYRPAARARLARRFGLDPHALWLLTVAMMRAGDKVASYRVLGEALSSLVNGSWQLLVAGDGPARSEVHAALAGIGERAVYAGLAPPGSLPEIYAAADLYLWPAINEAYGMTLLEAQAAGLPVVAGTSAGVSGIVGHDSTGVLTPPGDARAFAEATQALIEDGARRRAMGAAALQKVAAVHDIAAAAETLDEGLRHCTAASEA